MDSSEPKSTCDSNKLCIFKVWCKVNLNRLQLLNESRHLYITGQGLCSSTPFMVPHVIYYLKLHRAINVWLWISFIQTKVNLLFGHYITVTCLCLCTSLLEEICATSTTSLACFLIVDNQGQYFRWKLHHPSVVAAEIDVEHSDSSQVQRTPPLLEQF